MHPFLSSSPVAPSLPPSLPLLSLPSPTHPQVREGLLPSTYRTQLCDAYLEGRECPKRAACNRVHSLDELRVEAGIAVSGCWGMGAA